MAKKCKMVACVIFLMTVSLDGNISNDAPTSLLSYIPDNVIRQAVQEYIELCPLTAICGADGHKNGSTPVSREVCCSDCSCSDDCGRSCCPDKPTTHLSDQEVFNIKQEAVACSRLQYKNVAESSTLTNHAYKTVVLCPPGYGDEVINRKCIRDYKDFDFTQDLHGLVPVSNQTTIFKNKYCATCHGFVTQERLEFWDIRVVCQEPAVFPPVKSLMEAKNTVDAIEKCDFFFQPSDMDHKGNICKRVIDKCNVTGHWREFDADTERACLSYTSNYYEYKNVHCFLCNKRDDESVEIQCFTPSGSYNPNSFAALLDFQNLQNNREELSTLGTVRCPTDSVYDDIKDECRLLNCPDYMYVDGTICLPLFTTFTQFYVYDIVITLEPRDIIRNHQLVTSSIEALYNSLEYNIFTTLKSSQSEFHPCAIFGMVVLKNSIINQIGKFISEERNNLLYSEIEYFAFRVQIRTVPNPIDALDEARRLEGLFNNSNQIPALMPFKIRFTNIPDAMFDRGLKQASIYRVLGNSARDVLMDTLRLDETLHNALGSGFEQGSDGLHIAPLFQNSDAGRSGCTTTARYQIKPSCPKMELFADEFTLLDDGILIKAINTVLPNNDIIFTMNTSVYVCYQQYLSAIEDYRHKKNAGSSGIRPITVVTIISLSLSLVALLVTIIIYTLFETLRSLPGLNILGLVTSLFIAQFLTLMNGVATSLVGKVCIGFGVALHFSLMMAISWMFVCTFHMAKVFINIEKMSPGNWNKWHTFVRYCTFTVCISALFVAINVVVSVIRSKGGQIGYGDTTCYLETTDMMIFTVAIPIGIVVLANIIMFFCAMVKIARAPSVDLRKNNDRNNVSILAKLSTITGMTWVFGFLYQFTGLEAFSYIFVILNASQGVFIMMAFVMNSRVARMVKIEYKERFSIRSTEICSLQKTSHNRVPVRNDNPVDSQDN